MTTAVTTPEECGLVHLSAACVLASLVLNDTNDTDNSTTLSELVSINERSVNIWP